MATPHYVKSFYQSGSAAHVARTRWGMRVVAETTLGRLEYPKRAPGGGITYQNPWDMSRVLRSVLVPRAFRWLEKQATK